ncbi:nucleotidyltransferase [candidate division KSB1 bacterium]|nr:nucleotidyltransferase [candidate division KSB1 bacterium]
MLNRYLDVFKSFQKNNVKYVVIGGIASILHGVPRATFDLDILIEATPQNAARLLAALIEANLGTALLTNTDEILKHEISIFQDRIRIDVQTQTPGLDFDDAWKNRLVLYYQGQEFYILSKDDLIISKLTAGREIDLSDVRLLKLAEKQANSENK